MGDSMIMRMCKQVRSAQCQCMHHCSCTHHWWLCSIRDPSHVLYCRWLVGECDSGLRPDQAAQLLFLCGCGHGAWTVVNNLLKCMRYTVLLLYCDAPCMYGRSRTTAGSACLDPSGGEEQAPWLA